MRFRDVAKVAAAIGLAAAGAALAQIEERTFSARLTWVPISGAERDNVAGGGTATAALSGSRLTVTGSFEGLPAAATAVRLHHGIALGVRGPAIAELEITREAAGRISGDVELTVDQRRALEAGRLYLQVHTERGVEPDGSSLWGWFLP